MAAIPIQGAILAFRAIQTILRLSKTTLLDAISNLQFCHTYLEGSGLSKRYSQLFTAVADALNSTSEAIEHCNEEPDTAPITNEKLDELNPF
jgi:hypothetical protein